MTIGTSTNDEEDPRADPGRDDDGRPGIWPGIRQFALSVNALMRQMWLFPNFGEC
jgi:hypothetical protein